MISKAVLREMGRRTCAIGVLKVPHEEWSVDLMAPHFKICGTGFLVGPRTVLTNRHVLEGVAAYIQEHGFPPNRRYVAFVEPEGAGVRQVFREFEKAGFVVPPSFLDLGLVTVRTAPNDSVEALSPVIVPATFRSEVGDPVALIGYAFGENLLKAEVGERELLYRFGPVLQQGYISAVAPYDHSGLVLRVLLDVRTARGMSGCPVFDPASGDVLAVHSSGIEDTVAFALPLSAPMLRDMLAIHAQDGPVGSSTQGSMSRVGRAKGEDPAQ